VPPPLIIIDISYEAKLRLVRIRYTIYNLDLYSALRLLKNPEIFLKVALRTTFKNISVLLKASIGC